MRPQQHSYTEILLPQSVIAVGYFREAHHNTGSNHIHSQKVLAFLSSSSSSRLFACTPSERPHPLLSPGSRPGVQTPIPPHTFSIYGSLLDSTQFWFTLQVKHMCSSLVVPVFTPEGSPVYQSCCQPQFKVCEICLKMIAKKKKKNGLHMSRA